ncbi:hypothetical protein Btru_059716 [Bulinus truncatus]|nr:hypothetical protein Btru_059716 [Bulinus truncatus]
MLLRSVNYTHTQLPGTPLYYQSECTWISNVSTFEPGSYSFYVAIYPMNASETYGIHIVQPSVLNLTLPNAKLSNDCINGPNISDGYIKPGASMYCYCYLSDIGYPAGQVVWSDNSFNDVGIKVNTTATEILISTASDTQEFFCSALTSLKNGIRKIMYSVFYAKGPSKCEILPEQTIWNQCNNNIIIINTTCEVEKFNVIPAVKTSFFVNSVLVSNITENQLTSNKYMSSVSIGVIAAGNLSLACQVQNSIFTDQTAVCYQQVHIRVPPTIAPILQIDNFENVAAVQENKLYNISCIVNGGIPAVSNISVFCGDSILPTQNGNIFTANIKFTRNMTGYYCTCTAQHVTGCYYNNTSKILLNVLYLSTVINFKTQNSVSNFDNGSLTTLICEADGNPTPTIKIIKGNNILYQNNNGYFLIANKTFVCSDTGKYYCHADNQGLQEKPTETLFIYVNCPLQFVDTHETQLNLTQIFGETLHSIVNIYGYPEPSNFQLIKFHNGLKVDEEIKLKMNNDYLFISDDNKTFVKYSYIQLPVYAVEIVIRNLTALDFTNYSLVIIQDRLHNLDHRFYIKEVIKTSSEIEPSRPSIAAIIGGTVSGIFLIVIIVVTIIIIKKYVTTILDEHKYETPKIDFGNSGNATLNSNDNIKTISSDNRETKLSSSTAYC